MTNLEFLQIAQLMNTMESIEFELNGLTIESNEVKVNVKKVNGYNFNGYAYISLPNCIYLNGSLEIENETLYLRDIELDELDEYIEENKED